MDNLAQVTDYNFDPEVLKCDIPVLTHFLSEWSAPCKKLAESLVEIAVEYAGKLKVVEVDIDASPAVTAQYTVLNVPTLILFKNGQEVVRLAGWVSRDEVLEKILPLLKR